MTGQQFLRGEHGAVRGLIGVDGDYTALHISLSSVPHAEAQKILEQALAIVNAAMAMAPKKVGEP